MIIFRVLIVIMALGLAACEREPVKPLNEAVYGEDYKILDNGMVVAIVGELDTDNMIVTVTDE